MTTPRELLSAVYAAAGARDWDRVESLLHPDFVLHEAKGLPFGGEWHLPRNTRNSNTLLRCGE